ncbi:MAG: alpha/beta hydrolase [Geminicoccaceae bacterium]|nr:alpha/beta hydrolase [Geminicoccaceae bacterium]
MAVSTFLNNFGRDPGTGSDPVIFIHGAGMDSSVWALQARFLAARGLPVIAPDLPGHGRSGGEALTTIDGLAGWIVRILGLLDARRSTLVGHSMGALIAIRAAAMLGERADGLVVLGAAGRMPVHPDLIAAARDDLPAAAALVGDWAVASGMEQRAQPVPGTSVIWQVRRLLEASRPGVLATDLEACNTFRLDPGWLRQILCPALVVAGARDRMAPARKCVELATVLGGEAVTMAGSGHMMMIEEAAALRRLLFSRLGDWRSRAA